MQLPGYETTESLHLGRKRQIFRARRELDGARVIIKVLAAKFPSPAETASLRREFEILESLSLPGIVRAHALEMVRDRLALVLEDREGRTLRELLGQGPLPVPQFLAAARALAETVAGLHRHGIIHKDINPGNILVHPESGAVTLLDFGIASRVDSESQGLVQPQLLEGTIAYMSPEQTGRMNRDVDYRTDLYSLGVSFYEMLTGRLPFDSADPLEVIHCHIARRPIAPAERVPGLPPVLSDLVMKLLAKAPEDRYQSGRGLAADLARCQEQWRAHGSLGSLVLGSGDVPDRFVIPQRLYGRTVETARLEETFARVSLGGSELVLVAGYSGIGKTSLIQEIYKALPHRKGRFIAGKFDQLARDVPYGALMQAFRGLVRQLLTESDQQVREWAGRLTTALGGNAGLLVEVIPELERILGPQPAVAVLGAAETQNRFNLVFRKFVGVFARPEHPLVLFLDDLQWADAATLALLPLVLTDPEIRGLLLIGAYRDNEVSATHPLRLAVADLISRKVPLVELWLPALDPVSLREFIADTLRTSPEQVAPVADVVLGKTGGNPFFVTQFLQTLHHDGLILCDQDTGEWRADAEAIQRVEMTDNIVDLMTARIQRLTPDTERMLRLAACVGNQFDLDTLATVSEQPAARTVSDLWEAVREGLIQPLDKSYGFAPDFAAGVDPATVSYRFLHDRVQQAAYALIPEDARREVHLMVGRRLLAKGGSDAEPELLFDVVNHLNFGSSLLTDEAERLRLAELNVAAGRKSKASAAYPNALTYFTFGASLVSESTWARRYQLAFSLHLEQAEAEYLCGQFAEAEASFRRVIERAGSPLDRADAHAPLIVQYETMQRFHDAIRTGTEALQLLGITLPETAAAKQDAVAAEVEAIAARVAGRELSALVDLPVMEDPRIHRAMKVLASMWASAYILADIPLSTLIAARLVSLSLEFGNCEESAFGYVLHAVTVGSGLGDFATGHAFGELALEVNRRLDDRRLRAKVNHMFSAFVNLWRRPFATCLPHAREAYRVGLESGDLQFAGYGIFHQSWYGFQLDTDLEAFVRGYGPSVETLGRVNMAVWADVQQLILSWARALQGRTAGPTSLTGPEFSEEEFRRRYEGVGIIESFFVTAKLGLLYTFDAHTEAAQWAGEWETTAERFVGSMWPAMFVFYYALSLAAAPSDGPDSARVSAKLSELVGRLRTWAENSPDNFEHQYHLVEAEIARREGRVADAITGYEAAIDAGSRQPSPRHRALANELYAKFWLARQQAPVAAAFMTEARFGYAAWGALAKVADLERRYPELTLSGSSTRSEVAGATRVLQTTETSGPALDAMAVARAAQAISREIDLERLLERLLRVALESAGAERGSFLMEQENGSEVYVEGTTDDVQVRVRQPTPLADAALPVSVVNYVRRSAENVVLDDVAGHEQFGQDPYILRERPRSVLCTPVLNQSRLVGVLYMENRLAARAFTPDRVQLLQILSSQAAIAIQNSRLFAEVVRLRDRLQAENVYLQEEIKTQHGFEEIIGSSPALRHNLRQVEQVAPTAATVLIRGETGTGKELLARAIHQLSPRRERPLVSVNCGAISPGLVESELFGHEKGAFTGAIARKIGRFELADGGTLFLDEIGDLTAELQVKLLRVLQEGEFERVGGNRPLKVDVRVIAATHRDLRRMVKEGTFRQDLFYRLNVFPIDTPPLRERKEDIPTLVRHFVLRHGTKLGRRIETIPRPILHALTAYDWPGNVRELANVIERSVIISRGATLELGDWGTAAAPDALEAGETTLKETERQAILRALERTGWVVSGKRGAAMLLGLKSTTLEARMKKLGIRRPATDGA
jgi:predicted ATPase/transcriptional regulator with GAF, ATPase, and Fis domain